MLFNLEQPEGRNWVGKLILLYNLQTCKDQACTGTLHILGVPLVEQWMRNVRVLF